jgi:hypothetical protein
MAQIDLGNGLVIDGVEIPVPQGDATRPALDMPVRGARRIVKAIDLKDIGTNFPIIWTSPYEIEDHDLRKRCRKCVVLLAKEPTPQLCILTIPSESLEKDLRETVVEW